MEKVIDVNKLNKAQVVEYAKELEKTHENDIHLAETVRSKDAEILSLKNSIKSEIDAQVSKIKKEYEDKILALKKAKSDSDEEVVKEYKRIEEKHEQEKKVIAESFEKRIAEAKEETNLYKAALQRRADELEQGLYQFDAFIKNIQGSVEMAVELRGLLNEKITRK